MTSLRIYFSLSPSVSISLPAGGKAPSVLAGLSHTLYCTAVDADCTVMKQ